MIYSNKFAGLAARDTLFVHGNLASSFWWEPTIDAWKKAGSAGSRSLFVADCRGCGQNPALAATARFTLDDLAQDMLEVVEREKMERPALVGHSLGGLIAARMMMLAPQRFKTAVLLDPVGPEGVVFDPAMYEAFDQMAASAEFTKLVILSTIKNASRLTNEFSERIARDAFKAVKGVGTSVLEVLKSVDLRKAARKVDVPVLLLHGADDAVIPFADAEKWAACLPHAQLKRLNDVGHCWNVEAPADFVETLRGWLNH